MIQVLFSYWKPGLNWRMMSYQFGYINKFISLSTAIKVLQRFFEWLKEQRS